MTKTPVITDEAITLLNPDEMSVDDRVDFITDARIRNLAGETLTTSHLRFSVRCIRSARKASAAAAGAKKKPEVAATSLSEF